MNTVAVYVNSTPVGVAKSGDWDDAMREVCDFAEAQYGAGVSGRWNNYAQRRALCLEAFAHAEGAREFPALTPANSRQTDKGMMITVDAARCDTCDREIEIDDSGERSLYTCADCMSCFPEGAKVGAATR